MIGVGIRVNTVVALAFDSDTHWRLIFVVSSLKMSLIAGRMPFCWKLEGFEESLFAVYL